MNSEIKLRWIADLRNPDAVQIKNGLGKPDGSRCCLGVLSDLAVHDKVIDPPSTAENFDGEDELAYDGYTGYAPNSVTDWADLDPFEAKTLASMNDDGYTFPQIADYIEENL